MPESTKNDPTPTISDEDGHGLSYDGVNLLDPNDSPAWDFYVTKGNQLTYTSTVSNFTLTNFRKVGDSGGQGFPCMPAPVKTGSAPLPVTLRATGSVSQKPPWTFTSEAVTNSDGSTSYVLGLTVQSGPGVAGHYTYTIGLTGGGGTHDPEMEIESG